MTGREKIEAAMSRAGSGEVPAVICYERLFIRDHAEDFGVPWWYWESPESREVMEIRSRAAEIAGLDWAALWQIPARKERARYALEERDGRVYRIETASGREEELHPSRGGHYDRAAASESATIEDIERAIPVAETFDAREVLADGRGEIAVQTAQRYGSEKFLVYYVSSPLWSCFDVFGFENTMMLIAERPELAACGCDRMLKRAMRTVEEAALLGAKGIWIEECFTELLSACDYRKLALPYVRQLTEYARGLGLMSIHYFCGNPQGKWEMLFDAASDALAFEEGKKNFENNIEDIIEQVQGKRCVLGNLDAVGMLQDGSDDRLRNEIRRQVAAGKRNKHRFIMSTGSPVTPSTRAGRVRKFCEMVRGLDFRF